MNTKMLTLIEKKPNQAVEEIGKCQDGTWTATLENLRHFERLCMQIDLGLKYVIDEMAETLPADEGFHWAIEERIKDLEKEDFGNTTN